MNIDLSDVGNDLKIIIYEKLIKEMNNENKRLHLIIKEAKDFIYQNAYDEKRKECIDDLWGEIPKLLEILDKENKDIELDMLKALNTDLDDDVEMG